MNARMNANDADLLRAAIMRIAAEIAADPDAVRELIDVARAQPRLARLADRVTDLACTVPALAA